MNKKAMKETQSSISTWATETFGPSENNMRVATRANEEMSELLKELSIHDSSEKSFEEAADVVIVLYRLFERNGRSLQDEINHKMAINRARDWKLDGTGHGYHIKDAK